MALVPIEPEVVERGQAELKEKLMSGLSLPQVNVDIIRELVSVKRFEFPEGSGNWFKVGNVPYVDGLKLKDLYLRIAQSQTDTNNGVGFSVYELQLREILDICWKLCIPERRGMRIMRKLLRWRNPFLKLASEGDVGVLISFFIVHRMKSSVQFDYHPVL